MGLLPKWATLDSPQAPWVLSREMTPRRTSTVSDIVDALGGRSAVAELCEVTYNAVCNWIAWNAFPQRVHLRISRACKERRIQLPEQLFEAVNPGAKRAAVGGRR